LNHYLNSLKARTLQKAQTHTHTNTNNYKAFNLVKNVHIRRHSELAWRNCQGSWVQSTFYQNRL